MSMFPKVPAYFTYHSTGCSCCRNENYWSGPYQTIERAISSAAWMASHGSIGSQYARNGVHEIFTAEAEILPDGRLIIDDRVFDDWGTNYLRSEDSMGEYIPQSEWAARKQAEKDQAA